jgi:hypothetical protein
VLNDKLIIDFADAMVTLAALVACLACGMGATNRFQTKFRGRHPLARPDGSKP